MKNRTKLLVGATGAAALFVFIFSRERNDLRVFSHGRRKDMKKDVNEIKIPAFLEKGRKEVISDGLVGDDQKEVVKKPVIKLKNEFVDKTVDPNVYEVPVDLNEIETAGTYQVSECAKAIMSLSKDKREMTQAARQKHEQYVRALSEVEMEVVLENIPVELCLARVMKEIEELQTFKNSVENAMTALSKL